MTDFRYDPIDGEGQRLAVGDEIGIFCHCGQDDCSIPDGLIHTVTAIVDDPVDLLQIHPRLFVECALNKSPAVKLDDGASVLACQVVKINAPEVSDASWSSLTTATGWSPTEVH